MPNPIETWKSEKHPFDVWPDVERYAAAKTPMTQIDGPDLERMKWHGLYYRKRDASGRYMTRIRITAGELQAVQAREIANIAYEYGHGVVDVTTRANLQVQGLEVENLPRLTSRLDSVDLSAKQTGHDNIRNVFAHPFSGLMHDELIDTRSLCHEITALFVDSRTYSDLPRKLNICLNGTDSHSAHFWTQDLSFLATEVDGRVMFYVLIAGTQGQNPHLAWHLPILVAPDQVVDVTRSIMDLFRTKGSREKRNKSRLRFLIEDIGVGGVLQWLEQDLPFRLQPCVSEPVPASGHDELVGWFRQRDPGLWTMGLSVPLGRMTWQQMEGLALLSTRWGDGQLRTTHEQGIAVVNIPTGFKNAAATDAAGLGLTVHADPFELNTMACTGSQFCNIAVTETKGHMFQLIEQLRKRALKLHGIRIHMSGCPSSCAQHFTADIGLKGVRVRRIIGTREGFDVFLGGGIAGQVHMGLPYRLGVDVDQLPTLIEDVVQEFYLKHRTGQTFSAYWREKLQAAEAVKVGDTEYQVPVWLCENCDYQHNAEDPPVFCPTCAGLRRHFVRLEGSVEAAAEAPNVPETPVRTDGFTFAAKFDAVAADAGLTVEVDGDEYALFRVGEEIRCTDSECPHEGAPLADGEFRDGVAVCPWHSWEFDTCTGCSVEPAGHSISTYETLVEDGNIFIRRKPEAAAAPSAMEKKRRKMSKAVEAELSVLQVLQETPDIRTFRLDNTAGAIPFEYPGTFVRICVPTVDGDVWRSFTVSSSPTDTKHIDVTIKLNPSGVVTPNLFENITAGSSLKLKGTQGGFYFDSEKHPEPLVLISAGSGITPMMSIVRMLKASGRLLPVTFLYGARTEADVVFRDECEQLAKRCHWFKYDVTLSQPSGDWAGSQGRVNVQQVLESVKDVTSCRFFLCGPNEFMDDIRKGLTEAMVPTERIHTEEFHAASAPVSV